MQVYWKCDECDECNPYPGRGVCESCGARMTPAAERAALLRQEEEKRRLEIKRRKAEESRGRKAKADERLPKDTPGPSRTADEKEMPSAEPVWKSVWDCGFSKVFQLFTAVTFMVLVALWIILMMQDDASGAEFRQSSLYETIYFWVYEAEIILILALWLHFAAVLLLLHIYIAAPSKRKPLPKEYRLRSMAEEACVLIQCYYTSLWLTVLNYIFWNSGPADYISRINGEGTDYGLELSGGCVAIFFISWFVMYLLGAAVRAVKVPKEEIVLLRKKGEKSPYAILQIVSKAGRYSLFCGVLFILLLIFFA